MNGILAIKGMFYVAGGAVLAFWVVLPVFIYVRLCDLMKEIQSTNKILQNVLQEIRTTNQSASGHAGMDQNLSGVSPQTQSMLKG